MIKTKEEEKGYETSAGKWEKRDKKKISLITGGEGREERNSEKFKALHMGEKRKREKRVSWISVNFNPAGPSIDVVWLFLRLQSSRLEDEKHRDGIPLMAGNLGSFVDKYMILLSDETVEAQIAAYSVLSALLFEIRFDLFVLY